MTSYLLQRKVIVKASSLKPLINLFLFAKCHGCMEIIESGRSLNCIVSRFEEKFHILYYQRKDLVISSWMDKYSASFRSMRFRMRQRNDSPSAQHR